MKFSPFPHRLVPLRPKYSPQHPILKHPQLTFLPQYQRASFTPIQQILPSTPYSQTPSAYVPPSMSVTQFHTHTTNIPLNTLFSNTLSLRSSLNISDPVSHPHNKYSPQHPILKHPQPTFHHQYQRTSFTPIQQIFPSTAYSQTPSAYVPPSISVTKFHT